MGIGVIGPTMPGTPGPYGSTHSYGIGATTTTTSRGLAGCRLLEGVVERTLGLLAAVVPDDDGALRLPFGAVAAHRVVLTGGAAVQFTQTG